MPVNDQAKNNDYHLNYIRIIKLKLSHIEDKISKNDTETINEDINGINKIMTVYTNYHNSVNNKINEQQHDIQNITDDDTIQNITDDDTSNDYYLVSDDENTDSDDSESIKHKLNELLNGIDNDDENENENENDDENEINNAMRLTQEAHDMMSQTLITLDNYKYSRNVINIVDDDDDDEYIDNEDNVDKKNTINTTFAETINV
jgi:hypothetical protein